MKICYVNCSTAGSTGSLVMKLSMQSQKKPSFIVGDKTNHLKGETLYISFTKSRYIFHRIGTFLFGNDGLIKGLISIRIRHFLKKNKPDLIHIHNVHRSFTNVEAILEYAFKSGTKVVWTLHDEWILTGRCASFQNCEKWKNGCGNCKNKEFYPKSLFDCSKKYWKKKHLLINKYSSIITFVSPSQWLMNLVHSEYPNIPIYLIRNGVDQSIFKPSPKLNDLLQLSFNKTIIGCVMNNLSKEKGFDDLLKISKLLDEKKYCIFVLGSQFKDEITKINNSLFAIRKNNSKEYISSFYSTINFFLDLTKGDNYPTTHLECLSCGTPILTYNVGGAGEMIIEGNNGFVVKKDDINECIEYIQKMSDVSFVKENIIKAANCHDIKICIEQYNSLYNKLI